MDLKQLIKEAHETAVEKGWWDDPQQPFENQIVNMHCELSEAWEDWRNNRGLNEIYYECKGPGICPKSFGSLHCPECKYYKPRGIPIELADTIIRICDTLGAIADGEDPRDYQMFSVFKPQSLALLINFCHENLNNEMAFEMARFDYLFGTIRLIETYCQDNQIDLEKAIELKMAYNKTRPHRHSSKRA